MMLFDPKKAITTIMGRRRNPDGSKVEAPMKASEMKEEGSAEADPRHEAMKDFLMASKEGHPGKMTEAMAAFHDLHSMHKNKAEKASEEM